MRIDRPFDPRAQLLNNTAADFRRDDLAARTPAGRSRHTRSVVRTSCEHQRDHARPRAGHVLPSDPLGLRGFRGREDPALPALPSPEPEW